LKYPSYRNCLFWVDEQVSGSSRWRVRHIVADGKPLISEIDFPGGLWITKLWTRQQGNPRSIIAEETDAPLRPGVLWSDVRFPCVYLGDGTAVHASCLTCGPEVQRFVGDNVALYKGAVNKDYALNVANDSGNRAILARDAFMIFRAPEVFAVDGQLVLVIQRKLIACAPGLGGQLVARFEEEIAWSQMKSLNLQHAVVVLESVPKAREAHAAMQYQEVGAVTGKLTVVMCRYLHDGAAPLERHQLVNVCKVGRSMLPNKNMNIEPSRPRRLADVMKGPIRRLPAVPVVDLEGALSEIATSTRWSTHGDRCTTVVHYNMSQSTRFNGGARGHELADRNMRLAECRHELSEAEAFSERLQSRMKEELPALTQNGRGSQAIGDFRPLRAGDDLSNWLHAFCRDSSPEEAAVKAYTSETLMLQEQGRWESFFRVCNAAFRTNNAANFRPYMSLFVTGLSRLPVFAGECYRGMVVDSLDALSHFEYGSRCILWCPQSASLDKSIALGYTEKAEKKSEEACDISVLVTIVSTGAGRDVSGVSIHGNEKEVIMMPGYEWDVVERRVQGRQLYVTLRQASILPLFDMV